MRKTLRGGPVYAAHFVRTLGSSVSSRPLVEMVCLHPPASFIAAIPRRAPLREGKSVMASKRFLAGLMVCMLLPLTSARAEEDAAAPQVAETQAPHLGIPGQWFVGGSTAGTLLYLVQNSYRGVNFGLGGSAGYFFTDWMFARAGLTLSTATLGLGSFERQTTNFSLTPGIGFRVPLGRLHAFLPSLSYVLTIAQSKSGAAVAGGGYSSQMLVSHGAAIDLAFSIALLPHLNLLLGPTFTQIVSTSGTTSVSLVSAINAGLLYYF